MRTECPRRCGWVFDENDQYDEDVPVDDALADHAAYCPKAWHGGEPHPGTVGWPRPGGHIPRHVYIGPDREHEVLVLVVDAEHVDAVSAWVVDALAHHVDSGHPYPVPLKSAAPEGGDRG